MIEEAWLVDIHSAGPHSHYHDISAFKDGVWWSHYINVNQPWLSVADKEKASNHSANIRISCPIKLSVANGSDFYEPKHVAWR
jgi:hypothetical protein